MRRMKWIAGGLLAIVVIGVLAYLVWHSTLTTLGVVLGARKDLNKDVEIAFIKYPSERRDGGGDAYLFDLETGTLTQLTTNNRFQHLAWSAHGNDLILEDNDGKYSILEGVSGDLKPAAALQPNAPLPNADPTTKILSPDGKQLLTSSGPCCDYRNGTMTIQSKILVANADGSNSHELSVGEKPVWSPDGSQIAFDAQLGGDADPEIYVINSDGTQLHRVVANPGWDTFPVWSPDGTMLFFIKETFNSSQVLVGQTLFTIHADGQSMTKIDDLDYPVSFPQWSANSKWLLYSDAQDGLTYRIAPDGTERASLGGAGDYPALTQGWEGSSAAFISRYEHVLCIGVADAGGGNPTACIPGTLYASEPAWRPY